MPGRSARHRLSETGRLGVLVSAALLMNPALKQAVIRNEGIPTSPHTHLCCLLTGKDEAQQQTQPDSRGLRFYRAPFFPPLPSTPKCNHHVQTEPNGKGCLGNAAPHIISTLFIWVRCKPRDHDYTSCCRGSGQGCSQMLPSCNKIIIITLT